MTDYDAPVVVGSKSLPPDPSLVMSIGLHHSLPTAIADLVDNSIDAEARNVLIRVLQLGGRAVGLLVIDDGKGMSDVDIDAAMTYAHKRDYDPAALGHFGLGLKAASLSQAETLSVWSRAWGCVPAGRLLNREAVGQDHRVSVLDSDQAARRLDGAEPGFPLETGTIVEWRDIRTFISSSDQDERDAWLEQTLDDIRTHLGVVLHRIIAAGRVQILVDVFDLDVGEAGAPRSVTPIDPFRYPVSGAHSYPRKLRIDLPEHGVEAFATAHIWPPRGNAPEFRLYGEPGRAHQGFYFYRRDRLLQAGGWNGVVNARPDLELGRVSVDITDEIQPYITINPEKSGLVLDATLAHAIEHTTFLEGAGTFATYLADVEGDTRRGRSRQRRPIDVIEPRGGFPGELLAAFEDSLQFKSTEEPVDIKWSALPTGTVFHVDRERRTLVLNSRYRTELVGYRSLDPNDAPVLKALFHLLMSRHFEGSYSGAREKPELDAWQVVLSAALESQVRQKNRRRSLGDD